MRYLPIVISCILLFSCANTKKNSINDDNQVKADSFFENTTKYNIIGTAFYSTMYCGGAKPPDDIEEFHAKPREMIETTIVFKLKTDTTIFVQTKTDTNGRFETKLPEGIWTLSFCDDFENKNKNAMDILEVTKNCKLFFNSYYGERKVIKNDSNLILHFSLRCNPCDPHIYMRP
ncbi:MAG: hypothetical protein JXL97_14250 [Bacteroidales bacterium]|nr:hypothetical protein [Bacteroidales bacterium]